MRATEAYILARSEDEKRRAAALLARHEQGAKREREVAKLVPIFVSEAHVKIAENVREGRYETDVTVVCNEAKDRALAKAAILLREQGYTCELKDHHVDHGDSAAPCVVHYTTLKISWRNAK